jgi:Zn-dependent M28 family amino/carboxypeptidase
MLWPCCAWPQAVVAPVPGSAFAPLGAAAGAAAIAPLSVAAPAVLPTALPALSGDLRLAQRVIETLGSDRFEGRAPGTRGGELAEAYVRDFYKRYGMAPEKGKDYLQPVKLKGYTAQGFSIDDGRQTLEFEKDVAGTYAADEKEFDLSAEAVFVGFGIKTPIWDWDDFKDADVKGKLIIARVNDPGLYDETIFEGKTLTYFGRWTYHVEEALRRGAAGILLIHTDATAGYGWEVVKNSWGAEALLLPEDANNPLKFRGWVQEKSLERMLSAHGVDLQKLYEASSSRDFRPVPLGFSLRVKGKQALRELTAHNVVAEIPGKVKERIVLSAHIDHLGKKGDKIFNGAIDNGSAVAAMLMLAKELQEHQKDLYYTVTVLASEAEEAGLLGSRQYARSTDRDTVVANINFESTPVWEKAKSIMGVGARYSTLEDSLKSVASKRGWDYSEFSLVDQGFFYRADQFSFARAGIPSLWISAGEDDLSGQRKYSKFWKTDYHTPKDRFDPQWPLGGLEQTVEAAQSLIDELGRTHIRPQWKGEPPFPMDGVGIKMDSVRTP